MSFEKLLEQERDHLESISEEIDNRFIDSFEDDEIEEVMEDLGISEDSYLEEDLDKIYEELRRRVTSTGNVSKVRSKQYRSKRASRTTGLSKSALKRRGRKSAKTRKKSPGSIKKALRKRNKALRRRKAMGLKSGR